MSKSSSVASSNPDAKDFKLSPTLSVRGKFKSILDLGAFGTAKKILQNIPRLKADGAPFIKMKDEIKMHLLHDESKGYKSNRWLKSRLSDPTIRNQAFLKDALSESIIETIHYAEYKKLNDNEKDIIRNAIAKILFDYLENQRTCFDYIYDHAQFGYHGRYTKSTRSITGIAVNLTEHFCFTHPWVDFSEICFAEEIFQRQNREYLNIIIRFALTKTTFIRLLKEYVEPESEKEKYAAFRLQLHAFTNTPVHQSEAYVRLPATNPDAKEKKTVLMQQRHPSRISQVKAVPEGRTIDGKDIPATVTRKADGESEVCIPVLESAQKIENETQLDAGVGIGQKQGEKTLSATDSSEGILQPGLVVFASATVPVLVQEIENEAEPGAGVDTDQKQAENALSATEEGVLQPGLVLSVSATVDTDQKQIEKTLSPTDSNAAMVLQHSATQTRAMHFSSTAQIACQARISASALEAEAFYAAQVTELPSPKQKTTGTPVIPAKILAVDPDVPIEKISLLLI